MKKLYVWAGLLCLPLLANAGEVTEAQNDLQDCVIQGAMPGKNMTAGFFNLTHTGDTQKIISASVPALSDHTELHKMTMNNNIMKMEKLESYVLHEGENVFQKGDYHLMIFDLKEAPSTDKSYEMILNLDDGSQLSCEASVKTPEELINSHHHKKNH